MTEIIQLNSAADTRRLGSLLGSCLEDGAVIGLSGQLGAGKTTFTQGLAAGLGIDEQVNSPTFLMLNEYHSGKMPLYHFDLYRLQEDLDQGSPAALELKAELDELIAEGNSGVVVVEWIDLWEDFIHAYEGLRISLRYMTGEDGRQADLSANGYQAQTVLQRLASAWSAVACSRQESE